MNEMESPLGGGATNNADVFTNSINGLRIFKSFYLCDKITKSEMLCAAEKGMIWFSISNFFEMVMWGVRRVY